MRFHRLKVKDVGVFRGEHEWSFPPGLVAVTGPNGAGKTTLLGLLLGGIYRDVPTRGSLVALSQARDSFVELDVTNGQPWRLKQQCDAVSRKSEAFIMYPDGTPALESTKVRDADAWVTDHFPPLELVMSSLFSAQGTSGFCAASAGDRKAILLRLQGTERLEVMARAARDRAALVATEVGKLEALIAAERERFGDTKRLQADAEQARRELNGLEAQAEAAAAELAAAQTEATEAARQQEVYRALQARRQQLEADRTAARERLADIERRIGNNRTVLAEADQIRAAVAQIATLTAEAAALHGQAHGHEQAATAARRLAGEHNSAATGARARVTAAQARADRAATRGAEADAVRLAVERLPALEQARAAAEEQLATIRAELEAVRGQRLAGAEERIDGLRQGLTDICDTANKRPRVIAKQTLEADTERAWLAKEAPRLLAEVRRRETEAAKKLNEIAATVAQVTVQAARLPDIESAADDYDVATRDATAARRELTRHRRETRKLEQDANTLHQEQADCTARAKQLETEIEKLGTLAGKLKPLEGAEERLRLLTPQAEEWRQVLTGLALDLERLPPIEPPAPSPDLAPLEQTLRARQAAVSEAGTALARLHQRVELAQEAHDRITKLSADLATAEHELADWSRLGVDLGRKGLQAALIDAGLGEVTALTNELLHSSFGPRWTVRLDTQRSDARGKKQIEGLDVIVLDNEQGREAPIETYSGGERTILSEAVALALSALACRNLGTERPTLIRDESGAALDPEKAESYVAMLRRAATAIGAESVLLVSHSPEVHALCDTRIEL